jgi:hypothetical protein
MAVWDWPLTAIDRFPFKLSGRARWMKNPATFPFRSDEQSIETLLPAHSGRWDNPTQDRGDAARHGRTQSRKSNGKERRFQLFRVRSRLGIIRCRCLTGEPKTLRVARAGNWQVAPLVPSLYVGLGIDGAAARATDALASPTGRERCAFGQGAHSRFAHSIFPV